MCDLRHEVYPEPNWTKNKAVSAHVNKIFRNKERRERNRTHSRYSRMPRTENWDIAGKLLQATKERRHTNKTIRSLTNKPVDFAVLQSQDLQHESTTSREWNCELCTFHNVSGTHCEICAHPRKSIEANRRKDITLMCFVDSSTAQRLDNSWETDFDEDLQVAILASMNTSQRAQNPPSKPYLDARRPKEVGGHPTFCSYWEDSRQATADLARRAKIMQKRRESRERKQAEKKLFVEERHPFLKKHLPTPENLLRNLQFSFPGGAHSIREVFNEQVLRRFVGKNSRHLQTVFHGTSNLYDNSIRRIGLVPGGTHGVPIRHGSAYGRGVYCSPAASVASSYARGSMYICLLSSSSTIRRSGSIYVAPSEKHIIPCYVVQFQSTGYRGGGWSVGNMLVQFIPPHVPPGKRLNPARPHRAAKRRFSNRKLYWMSECE